MKKTEILAKFGTQMKAAVAIGTHQSCVATWDNDQVPWLAQLKYQAVTNNELQADPLVIKGVGRFRVFVMRDA